VKSLKTSHYVAWVFAVAIIAVAILGRAGIGQAATAFTSTFEQSGGATSTNTLAQVSYGGDIGYHLIVQNTGTTSTQHASLVVTSDHATYKDSFATFNGAVTTCSANPSDNHQMTCSVPDTLLPNDRFEATFRFTATSSTSFSNVKTTYGLSIAAQTVGGNNNKGTTLDSKTLTTALVADDDIDNSFLRGHETVATTGAQLSSDPQNFNPQNFSFTTPNSLLNTFAVAVGVHDIDTGGITGCATCLPWHTTVTVPLAANAAALTNPFSNANPYAWHMTAVYNPPFKVTGVAYRSDAGQTFFPIPTCDPATPLTPSNPVCIDPGSLVQLSSPKTISATGHGIENGNLGYG
jgi:hypothetical protein